MFKVIETFVSIDGEGPTSGELAAFVRFSDGNLRCAWCDTTYSWDGTSCVTKMGVEDIYQWIQEANVKNVTLTGGEPLIQPGIEHLLDRLVQDNRLVIDIETNGSIAITPLKHRYKEQNVHFIIDYKGWESRMNRHMCLNNLNVVDQKDVYKFVIASETDLQDALSVIKQSQLSTRCPVYFSPVTDLISPAEVVAFMKEKQLNDVRLQLQLHKYIWPKEMRGV